MLLGAKDGKIPGAVGLLSDGAQKRGDWTPLQGATSHAPRGSASHGCVGPGTNGTLARARAASGSRAAPEIRGFFAYAFPCDRPVRSRDSPRAEGKSIAAAASKVKEIERRSRKAAPTRSNAKCRRGSQGRCVALLLSLGTARLTGERCVRSRLFLVCFEPGT